MKPMEDVQFEPNGSAEINGLPAGSSDSGREGGARARSRRQGRLPPILAVLYFRDGEIVTIAFEWQKWYLEIKSHHSPASLHGHKLARRPTRVPFSTHSRTTISSSSHHQRNTPSPPPPAPQTRPHAPLHRSLSASAPTAITLSSSPSPTAAPAAISLLPTARGGRTVDADEAGLARPPRHQRARPRAAEPLISSAQQLASRASSRAAGARPHRLALPGRRVQRAAAPSTPPGRSTRWQLAQQGGERGRRGAGGEARRVHGDACCCPGRAAARSRCGTGGGERLLVRDAQAGVRLAEGGCRAG